MKKFIAAAVLCLYAGTIVAQSPDYEPPRKPPVGKKVGLTEKEFKTVTAALERNAKEVLLGGTAQAEYWGVIWELSFDEATWSMAKKYIASTSKMKDAERLYILARLLGPMLRSKPGIIHDALPTVRELEKKYRGAYKPYRVYSDAEIKSKYALPNLPRKGTITDEERMRMLKVLDVNRREKALAELPLTILAENIGELEKIYCGMMAFAQDPKEDQNLVRFIYDNEARKDPKAASNHVFTLAVEALNCEAASKQMSEARAKAIYPVLLQMGKPLEYNCRRYIAAYMPLPSLCDNSTFSERWAYTGYLILTSARLVGKAAKATPITVHNPSKMNPKFYKNDPEYFPLEKIKYADKGERPPG